jgi:hypothetical protein
MARTYYAQILRDFDWPVIVRNSEDEAVEHMSSGGESLCNDECNGGHVAYVYLGTVFSLTPSGKYYTAWTTNATKAERARDDAWFDALEKVAAKYAGWIEHGEDPVDLYFVRNWG